MRPYIQQNPQKLSLTGSQLSNESLGKLIQDLGAGFYSEVTIIEICDQRGLDSEKLKRLIEALIQKKKGSLVALRLNNVGLAAQHVDGLVTLLEENDLLISLDLGNNPALLDLNSVDKLGEVLAENCTLTTLNVDGSIKDLSHAKPLADRILENRKLLKNLLGTIRKFDKDRFDALIEMGVSVNQMAMGAEFGEDNGYTPLMVAVLSARSDQYGWFEKTLLPLCSNFDVVCDALSHKGKKAFMIAKSLDKNSLSQLLMQAKRLQKNQLKPGNAKLHKAKLKIQSNKTYLEACFEKLQRHFEERDKKRDEILEERDKKRDKHLEDQFSELHQECREIYTQCEKSVSSVLKVIKELQKEEKHNHEQLHNSLQTMAEDQKSQISDLKESGKQTRVQIIDEVSKMKEALTEKQDAIQDAIQDDVQALTSKVEALIKQEDKLIKKQKMEAEQLQKSLEQLQIELEIQQKKLDQISGEQKESKDVFSNLVSSIETYKDQSESNLQGIVTRLREEHEEQKKQATQDADDVKQQFLDMHQRAEAMRALLVENFNRGFEKQEKTYQELVETRQRLQSELTALKDKKQDEQQSELKKKLIEKLQKILEDPKGSLQEMQAKYAQFEEILDELNLTSPQANLRQYLQAQLPKNLFPKDVKETPLISVSDFKEFIAKGNPGSLPSQWSELGTVLAKVLPEMKAQREKVSFVDYLLTPETENDSSSGEQKQSECVPECFKEQPLEAFYQKLVKKLINFYKESRDVATGKKEPKQDNLKQGTRFIRWLGKAIPIPYLNLATDLLAGGIETGDKYVAIKKAAALVDKLKKDPYLLMREAAEQITRNYSWQISQLSDKGIKQLAEAACKRMLGYIATLKIENYSGAEMTQDEIVKLLVRGAIDGNPSNVKNTPLDTLDKNQHKDWTAEGLFKRSGLCVKQGSTEKYYVIKKEGLFKHARHSRVDKYGYRFGSKTEVGLYDFKEVDPPQLMSTSIQALSPIFRRPNSPRPVETTVQFTASLDRNS